MCRFPRGKRTTNRAELETRTPFVDTGYHDTKIDRMLVVPGEDAPCYACYRDAELPEGLDPEDIYKAIPKAPGNPSSPVTSTLSGALGAQLAIAYLTRVWPVEPGTLYMTNLLLQGTPEGELKTEHGRQPDCPDCSTITPKH